MVAAQVIYTPYTIHLRGDAWRSSIMCAPCRRGVMILLHLHRDFLAPAAARRRRCKKYLSHYKRVSYRKELVRTCSNLGIPKIDVVPLQCQSKVNDSPL